MGAGLRHRFAATLVALVAAIATAGVLVTGQVGERGAGAPQGRGEGRGRGPAMKLSDPVITDPAIQNGGIDMHAHQDPDSNGPSYGQAARSDDALDLYIRAKAAGSLNVGQATITTADGRKVYGQGAGGGARGPAQP